MTQIKRFTALFFAAMMMAVAGCAHIDDRAGPGEVVTDAWITTKVKAALVDSPVVKAREVNVETFKGQVQLSGFVSSEMAMNEAVRITRDIRGVTAVKNDMRIK
jgi:osmotically-inducible protein OsmY